MMRAATPDTLLRVIISPWRGDAIFGAFLEEMDSVGVVAIADCGGSERFYSDFVREYWSQDRPVHSGSGFGTKVGLPIWGWVYLPGGGR